MAFSDVPYPGDENIVPRSYDRRWGGSLLGPCRECQEVVEYSVGKKSYDHDSELISGVAF